MNPEHKRIVEMASAWEGSDAPVTLAPGDATLLRSVGAPVQPGKREIDPSTIRGRDLFAAAEKLKREHVATPEGSEPTPNQQSVSPGPVAPPNGPVNPPPPPKPAEGEAGDKLEELTVAELRNLAADRGLTVPSGAVKAQIIEAVRKAAK